MKMNMDLARGTYSSVNALVGACLVLSDARSDAKTRICEYARIGNFTSQDVDICLRLGVREASGYLANVDINKV